MILSCASFFQESIYEVELMERAMSEIPAVPSSPTPTNVA